MKTYKAIAMYTTIFFALCAICIVRCVPMDGTLCPTEFFHMENSCYHFSVLTGNWFQGLNYCQQKNAHLLSLETKSESDAINLRIHEINADKAISYWTSGSDTNSQGQFKWLSNENDYSYKNWCLGEPNDFEGKEDCMHLLYSGSGNTCWNDVDCTATETYYVPTKIHFICERAAI